MLNNQPQRTPETTDDIRALSAPPWTLDAEEATDKLAFGLDEGFISELRFFVATNEVGIVSASEGEPGLFLKYDLPQDVFDEVLKNFVGSTSPANGDHFMRTGAVVFTHPDDSERIIEVASHFFSPKSDGATQVDWPIVAVTFLSSDSDVSHPESLE